MLCYLSSVYWLMSVLRSPSRELNEVYHRMGNTTDKENEVYHRIGNTTDKENEVYHRIGNTTDKENEVHHRMGNTTGSKKAEYWQMIDIRTSTLSLIVQVKIATHVLSTCKC